MDCNCLTRSKPSFVGQPEIEAVLFLSVAGQPMEVSKGVSRFNRQIMYLVELCNERDACKFSGVWHPVLKSLSGAFGACLDGFN